ncbi:MULTISPECIES: P-type conjugative transfer ATPase TrbB [unclassified Mesorhizobium]|uniref:P-type conjugative transfer ATPase TrbB n=1 Tax=unclassified Mesorhizobium TaxID=325217 RepID=UPI001127BB72|nr:MULTISPECIES: P-type conjugative transfer ATPase TrbB [unclassified Mesorhizobium]MBZ9982575.1 P-type conjugative transfer ATPase TrbB [Mesorhizobium sp. BR-1-1-8]TPL26887.1 P-type conjugative transfer ATPase TrbB [Mesorhizobium sp. B2-4-8]TPL59259.1 P-type conjugative transfer ATPase TrbB [Mesorhizobium sp. B2-4-1]
MTPTSQSHHRLVRKLREAMGSTICNTLDDALVVEIMLNPDGQLFVERIGEPITQAGRLAPQAAETIIGTVAHALGTEVNLNRPIISGELPIGGHRFEGLLSPVVAAPVFTIRKRATRLFPLDSYVRDKIMTPYQAAVIRNAVENRMNIVVAGGTGTGKTTLTNAVIGEIVSLMPEHRLVILEDTVEIQCAAENVVALHTTDAVDMSRLLKSTMRLRPDRIIVGEVRDGAALTLLKAWNTGHPGGIATIHANSALSALTRLEQLTAEVSSNPMPEIIGEAVDMVISIERTSKGRRLRELLVVEGYRDGRYRIESHGSEEGHRHVA